MKKILSLFIALCLLGSCCMAEGTGGVAESTSDLPSLWKGGETHTIAKKEMPLYISSLESAWPADFPVYFVDGAADLPWLDLKDFGELMDAMLASKEGKEGESVLTVTMDDEKGTITWMRGDSDLVIFSFAEQQITWSDYQGFSRRPGRPYLDLLQGFMSVEGDGQPGILKAGAVRERRGDVLTLDLKKYGVPMLALDGLHLVPLQTLAAFFLSPDSLSLYCNQECLILTSPAEFNQMTVAMQSVTSVSPDDLTALQDLPPEEAEAMAMEILMQAFASQEQPTLYNTYRSGPQGERSLALADYGLHELAMELDTLYGLKDAHDIDDFMLYFLETGLLTPLMSADPAEADGAIRDLANIWLDDGHTEYYSGSYLAGRNPLEAAGQGGGGFSKSGRKALRETLGEIRRQALGDVIPGYMEIGDTAFVTLDGFVCLNADYYADTENLPGDTFAAIIDAHKQITRENSPVRNVVLDLSINNGGMAPAAVYLISWMVGDARISLKNTVTGAESTVEYRADVNLDHVFDEQDTLAGRGLRLFCLTSPASFSCGNLIPWAFKEDGTVKLLGSMTGGGSCVTLPLTTAWGTSYNTSGPNRLSFMKNGSYYDVDRGVEPDYVISSYERFYDREALAEYIRNLY